MLIKPVNFVNLLETKLTSKLLVRLLSPVISLLLRLRYPFRLDSDEKEAPTVKKMTGEFPSSIDELARDGIAAFEWILHRDKKYLDWRFVKNPDQYDIWLVVDGKKTLGYIVCKIGLWKNLRVGYIADFLVDEKCGNAFKMLLFRAMRFFLKIGLI